MRRTTILADEALLMEAKHLASLQGTTFTALVQDALRDYIVIHRPERRRISIAGIVHFANHWTADSLNEELKTDIDPIEGWSVERASREPNF